MVTIAEAVRCTFVQESVQIDEDVR